MTRYTATIVHHSIARAPVIEAGNTLTSAKRAATRRFGDGYLGHVIVVTDERTGETAARRVIGERAWRIG